jgi:hypothetical protein
LNKIDSSKFAQEAVLTAYGCNIGGASTWTIDQFETYSIANRLAIHLNIEVRAFAGSSLFKTVERTVNGKPIFDGTMIRAKDVNSQTTRLSSFYPDKAPVIKR